MRGFAPGFAQPAAVRFEGAAGGARGGGALRRGDVIAAVNNVDARRADFAAVCRKLQSAPGTIVLRIARAVAAGGAAPPATDAAATDENAAQGNA